MKRSFICVVVLLKITSMVVNLTSSSTWSREYSVACIGFPVILLSLPFDLLIRLLQLTLLFLRFSSSAFLINYVKVQCVRMGY